MSEYLPKWHRELDIFSKIKPILLLEGNVFDSYRYPTEGSIPKGSIVRLDQYLHYYFIDNGYKNVVFYDSVRGFYNLWDEGLLRSFAELTGSQVSDGRITADFKGRSATAPGMVREALSQNREATVVVMNFASRYITSPENMEQSEVDGFTMLFQASMEAREVKTPLGRKKNLVVAITNKVNDLPAWFYLDNPNAKGILIGTPSREEREQLIKGDQFPRFFDSDIYAEDFPYYESHPNDLEKIQDRFVGMTEGFSFTELNGLRLLSKSQRFRMRSLCDVVDLYKFGIKENPWNAIDRDEIRGAYEDFRKRVKGQDAAITRTLDVVKRAITGMSGIQSSSTSRPKGVLFFAGPTGTGKTETAKTLAEKLFGDERSCIRFDMSEYGQPHSDQKLLGAPPGYVGYEAGGQLTNAVRENPFSILLFDEIEKAHPSIFDKFLQILEDGRMTDGQGNTVYFSETVIIFTSNLGIYEVGADGSRVLKVSPDMSYEEVQKAVRRGVENYFKLQLGRPEILNRIGENIVVFDFIRPDVADAILEAQIDKIARNLSSEKGLVLELSAEAFSALREEAIGNLDNGGRGIGNIVEAMLINPLSRYLFDNEVRDGSHVTVDSIDTASQPCSLRCTVGRSER